MTTTTTTRYAAQKSQWTINEHSLKSYSCSYSPTNTSTVPTPWYDQKPISHNTYCSQKTDHGTPNMMAPSSTKRSTPTTNHHTPHLYPSPHTKPHKESLSSWMQLVRSITPSPQSTSMRCIGKSKFSSNYLFKNMNSTFWLFIIV
jgi:hypothetical protein